jgi:hypothetical protein
VTYAVAAVWRLQVHLRYASAISLVGDWRVYKGASFSHEAF